MSVWEIHYYFWPTRILTSSYPWWIRCTSLIRCDNSECFINGSNIMFSPILTFSSVDLYLFVIFQSLNLLLLSHLWWNINKANLILMIDYKCDIAKERKNYAYKHFPSSKPGNTRAPLIGKSDILWITFFRAN